jgi:hypothetical protein
MSRPKTVVVTRFEKPAESMLPGWPKHKIQDDCGACGVSYRAGFVRMNPLRTSTDHKLHIAGKLPRLLKEKISVPFPGAMPEKR